MPTRSDTMAEYFLLLTLRCSRCLNSTARLANPDEETTNWRARCGKTAHRVRREGAVIAVPYSYPGQNCCPTSDFRGRQLTDQYAANTRANVIRRLWALSTHSPNEEAAVRLDLLLTGSYPVHC